MSTFEVGVCVQSFGMLGTAGEGGRHSLSGSSWDSGSAASVQGVLLESRGKTVRSWCWSCSCKSRSSIVWWELCRPELQPWDHVWELGLLRLSSSTVRVSLSAFTALGILNTCWQEKQPLGTWLFWQGKQMTQVLLKAYLSWRALCWRSERAGA